MNAEIVLIAHNLRSCGNIGSLLRTADGLGISKVYLTGYTPYPKTEEDTRLPYIRDRVDKKIRKTALGAEESVDWQKLDDITKLLDNLKADGYQIVALEQTKESISLSEFKSNQKIALVVGREVEGIESEVLEQVDIAIFIPMLGKKESFNVVQAAAMALYKLRYFN